MISFLTGWLGKLGIAALYNTVKGFFDSFFQARKEAKKLERLEEQAEDRLTARIAGETLEQYKIRRRDRTKIEADHSSDGWDVTRKRMRLRGKEPPPDQGGSD